MTTADGVVGIDADPHPSTARRLFSVAEIVVVAYIAFVAVGSAVGLLIVHVFDHGSVGRDDESFVAMLARNRDTTLNHVSAFLSAMASTLAIAAVALVVAIVWRLVAKEWKGLVLLAIGLVLEVASFVTMATIVGRDRPDVVRLDQSPPTSSFPSGHTAASTVLYGAVAVLVFSRTRRTGPRVVALAVAIVVPVAVAFGRLYRGMHHPSDVLVGALLGLGALAVAALVVRRWNADEPAPVSGFGP